MVSADGFRVIMWNRWDGEVAGTLALPDGSNLQLSPHAFVGNRYACRLHFDPVTKKVCAFESLVDVAEWARMAGAPTLALAAGAADTY